MALQLLIPRSATEPRSKCFLCGTEFPADQLPQFGRHVKACAKRNGPRFEEMEADRQKTYFTSSADPELYDHLRGGGN